jgi:hypothetical protein
MPSPAVSREEQKDDPVEHWSQAIEAVDQQDWDLARSILSQIASNEAGPHVAESSHLLLEIDQALSRQLSVKFLKTLSTDDLLEIDAGKRTIPARFTRDSLQRAWAELVRKELPGVLADRRATAKEVLAAGKPKANSAGRKDGLDRAGYIDRTEFFNELREKRTVNAFLTEYPEAKVVPADTDSGRRLATYDYSAFTYTFLEGTIAIKHFNWPFNLGRINEMFDVYIAGLGPPDVTEYPGTGVPKPRRFAMWTVKERDVRCALTHYFDENLGDVLLIQAFCISQMDKLEAFNKPQR